MAFWFNLAVIRMKRRRKLGRIRRQGRRDICESHDQSLEIPFDPMIEILTRLPAKSLMRFKSVTKLWSSLICSQYFTNRFLNVSSSPPRLYMLLGLGNNNVLLSASASPDSDRTTMHSFVVDQDLTTSGMKDYSVSHVFRGFICFVNGASAKIYNTSTRQLVALPDIEESTIIAQDQDSMKIMYHIGHDPVHDQYKVVCTVCRRRDKDATVVTYMSEHWVFILGGQVSNRWRKIPIRCPPHRPLTQGLNINGRMHYLAWVRLLSPVLVSFDMTSEEISMLQKPEDANWFHLYTDIIEYGGRVALLHHIDLEDEGVMELWVMEDEEKNRWSRKTLVLHPSQMNIVNMHIVNAMSLRVQGTTRNGEVILVPQNRSPTRTGGFIVGPQSTTLFYVFLYNLQKNHLRKVEIKDTSCRYVTNIWDVIGFDDIANLMYL